MKRNLDLMRDLLFDIERKYDGSPGEINLDYDEYAEHSELVVTEHLLLLGEAGLIDYKEFKSHGGRSVIPFRMTGKGHDYLDSVRDPEIWSKTKKGAEAAGGLTLELIGEIAKGVIKTQLKKHTGIEI